VSSGRDEGPPKRAHVVDDSTAAAAKRGGRRGAGVAFPPGVLTVPDAEVARYLEACRWMIDDQLEHGLEHGPCLPGLLLIKGTAMLAFDRLAEAEA
jgi:hypothetical protein